MALTLAERLAEAKAAYHALQIGQSAVEVRDSSGESVRYTAANASRLKTYIAEIEAEIAAAAGTAIPRRPMRVFF